MKQMRRFGVVGLAMAFVAGCGDSTGPDEQEVQEPTPLEIDVGSLPALPLFTDNPTTVEGVELGRHLFFDPILSGDGTQSCADCHQQSVAFGDTGRVSLGITGAEGSRNAQVIVNPAWQDFQFWDGRAETLEDQARQPVENPVEMNAEWPAVVERISESLMYREMFTAAFGSPEVTQDRVVQAIAQFERTFVSKDSKFDRVQRGEAQFTEAEARGEELFNSERAECAHCHAGVFFTDNEFHDIGLDETPQDLGRADETGASFDEGEFKTPTLRNIEASSPYMHDGRFETLEEVLDHYSEGIARSPNLDPTLGVHLNGGATGLELTEQEKADIVVFLKTLTDEEFLTNPDFAPPPGL